MLGLVQQLSRTSRGGPAAPARPSPAPLAEAGNAARSEEVGLSSSSPGIADAEVGAWLSEGDGPGIHKAPLRVAVLKRGMQGALVGTGSPITLTATASGGRKQTVDDGSACLVLDVSGDRARVRVRKGDKNVEGWVDRALFSDNPGLTRDEKDKKLADDYIFQKFEGDHSPVDPKGRDTAQGAVGDCFFIAAMAAVANASPSSIKEAITFNKDKGTYTVRFFEEGRGGTRKPVYIEVDEYLPVERGTDDPAYAGDPGVPLWPAIMEKAYAKWKGGYDVIGEGGDAGAAMAELTGGRTTSRNPASMRESEVIPYFQQAQQEGKAIYAGVYDGKQAASSRPLSGSGDGPLKGRVAHTHKWNEIIPGSVRITDDKGKAPALRDRGKEGDETGKLEGAGLKEGRVGYKGADNGGIELSFNKGLGPAAAGDLKVDFRYEGVLNVEKLLIGNHAYAFEGVVNGTLLQFYNPWGSYQPKPITPAEFLEYFDSLAVNQAPKAKTRS